MTPAPPLKLFQNFIRFGSGTLPLGGYSMWIPTRWSGCNKREFLVIRIPRSLTCSCLTSSFPTQQQKPSKSQDLYMKHSSGGDLLLQKHFHNGVSTSRNTFTKGRRQPKTPSQGVVDNQKHLHFYKGSSTTKLLRRCSSCLFLNSSFPTWRFFLSRTA